MNKAIQTQSIPESLQLLGELADAMPHVVWIAAPDGTVLYYNKNVAEFSGAYQDANGRWYWEGVLYEEDLKTTVDAWAEAVRLGIPYEQEHRVKMRDGTLKWHLSRGIPQKDAAGNVIRWFGTATDIHEQKTGAERILVSEKRFRLLAETLPQLVWMTNQYGLQEYASSRWQAYTGIEPQDALTWQQVVHPDDLPIIASAWQVALTQATTYKAEVRLKRKDGSYRWHAVEAEPLRNEEGDILKWIGAFSDIHSQKTISEQLEKLVEERTHELYEANESLRQRNNQLQSANKELESFNYIASHDLQEPIRKIQTFINLLQHADPDEETIQNYLNRINISAQRMAELVKSILNYSHISKTEEPFITTDLNLVMEQVKVDLELLIDEKQAVITCGPLPTVQAVPIQIVQLLTNLLNNSLKFSDKRPIVSITATTVQGDQLPESLSANPSQQFVRLSIQDNGIGFDQQYAQKIFSLFQRLHGKHKYSGTGIGLAICKRIVEYHNGFILAESSPGQGARFLIFLPLPD